MASSEGAAFAGGGSHRRLRFRPGEMPPLFGDTAAALLVDDDDQVSATLARLLERQGYDCTLAANGG
jgi:hypothetical protein